MNEELEVQDHSCMTEQENQYLCDRCSILAWDLDQSYSIEQTAEVYKLGDRGPSSYKGFPLPLSGGGRGKVLTWHC